MTANKHNSENNSVRVCNLNPKNLIWIYLILGVTAYLGFQYFLETPFTQPKRVIDKLCEKNSNCRQEANKTN